MPDSTLADNPSPPPACNALRFPGVVGDGLHDDTAGLQAALDSGAATVYLPRPSGAYLISRPLVLGSGQTLHADRDATIRLADHAHAHMLTNSDHAAGNSRITVCGGLWDGNNRHQTCEYHQNGRNWHVPFDPQRYLGVLFQFNGVTDLRVAHLTLKDPETFGLQLGRLDRFTIEDLTFDYNLLRENMDGVHVHGPARHGRIANIKGATNDDQVALNADDGWMYEMSRGPIEDVHVDGVGADNGYTAVRLLSSGSPVRRVRISNVFGSYRYNVVSFTSHGLHPGEPSTFEDVLIDRLFCSKPTAPLPQPLSSDAWGRSSAPLIWFAAGTVTRGASVQHFHRTEHGAPSPPSVTVDEGAQVDYLALTDSSLVNHGAGPVSFLENRGTIGTLSLAQVRVAAVGGGSRGLVLADHGSIGRLQTVNITEENLSASWPGAE